LHLGVSFDQSDSFGGTCRTVDADDLDCSRRSGGGLHVFDDASSDVSEPIGADECKQETRTGHSTAPAAESIPNVPKTRTH
jgi:hypothetical protein